jgi:hypothetical protein
LGIGAYLAILVLVAASAARSAAQVGDGGTAEPAEAPPGAPVDEFNPFVPYPSDPGAITYDQLGTPVPLAPSAEAQGIPEEQYLAAIRETPASVDDAGEWADVHNGPSVTAAWSSYTNAMQQRALVQQAEDQAGLGNAATLGVE